MDKDRVLRILCQVGVIGMFISLILPFHSGLVNMVMLDSISGYLVLVMLLGCCFCLFSPRGLARFAVIPAVIVMVVVWFAAVTTMSSMNVEKAVFESAPDELAIGGFLCMLFSVVLSMGSFLCIMRNVDMIWLQDSPLYRFWCGDMEQEYDEYEEEDKDDSGVVQNPNYSGDTILTSEEIEELTGGSMESSMNFTEQINIVQESMDELMESNMDFVEQSDNTVESYDIYEEQDIEQELYSMEQVSYAMEQVEADSTDETDSVTLQTNESMDSYTDFIESTNESCISEEPVTNGGRQIQNTARPRARRQYTKRQHKSLFDESALGIEED